MHAIILAGGKGERLRPLTNDRPKGMVEVGGRPLLSYQMAWLQRHAVTDVTISCGYLADVIQGVALLTMVAGRLFTVYRLRLVHHA